MTGRSCRDQVVDLLLQLLEVHIRGVVREGENKAVLHVVVAAALHLLPGQAEFAQIFGGVGHEPVGQGAVDDVVDILGLRAEDGGPCDEPPPPRRR